MAAISINLDQALKTFKDYFDNPVIIENIIIPLKLIEKSKLSLSRKRDILD